jgi:hypothetical protein
MTLKSRIVVFPGGFDLEQQPDPSWKRIKNEVHEVQVRN